MHIVDAVCRSTWLPFTEWMSFVRYVQCWDAERHDAGRSVLANVIRLAEVVVEVNRSFMFTVDGRVCVRERDRVTVMYLNGITIAALLQCIYDL